MLRRLPDRIELLLGAELTGALVATEDSDGARQQLCCPVGSRVPRLPPSSCERAIYDFALVHELGLIAEAGEEVGRRLV